MISEKPGSTKKDILIAAGIFLLALAVRFIYLLEISKGPLFDTPVIDSATYLDIARNIVSTHSLDPRLFWQSFFYPLYLAMTISVFDDQAVAARIIQLSAGAVSAVLIYFIGKKLFDRKTAILAAVMIAICGTMFFFEGELLATGWASFISVVLMMLMIETLDRDNLSLFIFSGLAAGIAIAIRATFLPFILVTYIYFALRVKDGRGGVGRSFIRYTIMLAAFIIVLTGIAFVSRNITGHFSPMPRSGSINLYIGNNPDTDSTMMIRPGYPWRKLTREPLVQGFTGDSGHRKYFMDRYREYIVTDPAGFLKGIANKSVQFLSSRELPRNIDIYTGRKYSRLLSIAVWKIGEFGFPFGLILPFALMGLFYNREKIPGPVMIFLIVYPLTIIAVFVASRYRIVMMPVITLMSAAGITHFAARVKNREWKETGIDMGVIILLILLFTLPGPFVSEAYDYEAELYASAGYEQSKAGKAAEAEENVRKSLLLSPGYISGHRILGNILLQKGEFGQAEEQFRIVLRDDPGSCMVEYYLALALWRQGRNDEARVLIDSSRKGAMREREGELLTQIEAASKTLSREESAK
ncbi:MAG: glycosyltransferase family 39 protein [Candidatus Krumholzibacteriota bacterium]|nr:glycosyltransferase family 39 protein [Candidatus Krumholzibacteriota bacterium]